MNVIKALMLATVGVAVYPQSNVSLVIWRGQISGLWKYIDACTHITDDEAHAFFSRHAFEAWYVSEETTAPHKAVS